MINLNVAKWKATLQVKWVEEEQQQEKEVEEAEAEEAVVEVRPWM